MTLADVDLKDNAVVKRLQDYMNGTARSDKKLYENALCTHRLLLEGVRRCGLRMPDTVWSEFDGTIKLKWQWKVGEPRVVVVATVEVEHLFFNDPDKVEELHTMWCRQTIYPRGRPLVVEDQFINVHDQGAEMELKTFVNAAFEPMFKASTSSRL
jgi:hypothetical protein